MAGREAEGEALVQPETETLAVPVPVADCVAVSVKMVQSKIVCAPGA